tara:strand:+ start:326 stop:568 length:243 start_codon:yes stop_codon:yes gene_type:complete
MKKTMTCFKCKFQIYDKENYFEFIEFLDKKKVNTDYCHKVCWDKVKGGLNNTNEAMGMLRQLKQVFIKQGLFPEEKVVIK